MTSLVSRSRHVSSATEGTVATPATAASVALREILPVAVGVLPFGMTLGATIATASIGDLVGWLGGPLIAAGSAHLTVVTMLDAGGAALPAVLAALLVNLRIAIYSAVLAPMFARQPRWFRWVGAGVLVDQTFALFIRRQDDAAQADWLRTYILVTSAVLMTVWVVAITVGITLGPVIPDGFNLWFAGPVLFVAMLAPSVTTTPAVSAAVVAGSAAVALSGLPGGVGLLAAIVLGAAAGAFTPGGDHD